MANQQQNPPMYAQQQPGQPPVIYTQPQAGYYGAPQQYAGPPAPPGQPVQMVQAWAPPPTQVIPNCPPGLEYLSQLDQVLVHQQVELFEMISGFETNNKYVVKNSVGQKVFYAAENSSCCARYWCGTIRDFEMAILDNFGNEVIHISRPLACQQCCYPCCLQHVEVSSPPGNIIGTIEQKWNIFGLPRFDVKDASGDVILKIEGPFWKCSCGSDVNFKVLSKNGETEVGKISKQWTGYVREAYTDADNFGATFPMDLDVKIKAVLLAGVFLIDFMYFEQNDSGNNR